MSLQEVLHTISSPHGQVHRIVIFKKNGVQAMVEYPQQMNAFLPLTQHVPNQYIHTTAHILYKHVSASLQRTIIANVPVRFSRARLRVSHINHSRTRMHTIEQFNLHSITIKPRRDTCATFTTAVRNSLRAHTVRT